MFKDRVSAGRQLAAEVARLKLDNPIVLGLPRGGLPVAAEVARMLDAELDAIVVRKLGAPYQPELAMGAIASGGIRVLNEEIFSEISASSPAAVAQVERKEKKELERREALYRGARPFPDLHGRQVILVDDGIATGSTLRAAIAAVRAMSPAAITVAVPTAPARVVREISKIVEHVVCLESPKYFVAVGNWYRDFSQVDDAAVRRLIDAAHKKRGRVRDSTGRI